MQARTNVTDVKELQYRLIYSMLVAGKTAHFAQMKVQALFPAAMSVDRLPFDWVLAWDSEGELDKMLRKHSIGNYGKMEKGLRELASADLDLVTCTPQDLEAIHGIGPKTSRFFILWTRVGAPYAALDVHVLRWLGEQGHSVPRQTPTGKRYVELEKIFLQEARDRGMHPGDLDAQIWAEGAGRSFNPEDPIQ